MAQPNETQGIAALANLFRVVDQNAHTPAWYNEKARLAWDRYQNAESMSIPSDKETLVFWLDALK